MRASVLRAHHIGFEIKSFEIQFQVEILRGRWFDAGMPDAATLAPPCLAPLTRPAPQLSAVICTYDRYHVLPGAIDSLRAQCVGPELMEIIVVDNSPDQAAAAASRARYAGAGNLTYVLAPQPGLSDARNRGAALARGNFVGFIDDDAIASPGWAAAILEAFQLFGPRAGAVGGPARPLWLGERPEWLTNELLGHLSILDHGERPKLLPPGQTIVGCNMAFNRALLLDIGGFPPHLGRYGPELSLRSNGEPGVLNRVRQAGRDIGYTPYAHVDHRIDPSRLTQAWFRRRAAWQAVSDYLLDAQATANHAPNAARYLRTVENSATRARPIGFFGPEATGSALAEDLLLIRELMIATLHGGAERPSSHRPNPAARLLARLQLTLRRSGMARWVRDLRRRKQGQGALPPGPPPRAKPLEPGPGR
jgi:hypothetical protein